MKRLPLHILALFSALLCVAALAMGVRSHFAFEQWGRLRPDHGATIIRSERGLAANTLLAYGRDLERFALWAEQGGLSDHLTPTLRELTNYVLFLREQAHLAPPSVSRRSSTRTLRPARAR